MKYALMATIEFDTLDTAKRDMLTQSIEAKVAGKKLWTNKSNPSVVANGKNEMNKPTTGVMLRFDNKSDRDELAVHIKDNKGNSLSGVVHKHLCYHDEGSGNQKPCEPEQEI